MSNYVNLNTECKTSEPRQNVGIGQSKNKYKAEIWYHSQNPRPYPNGEPRKDADKCVVIYFDNLSVWDRQTNRMLTHEQAKHVIWFSDTQQL